MLRLISLTNTVARFTKELDKTNLFVKLKKQCTVEVLSVKKMTLVDFGYIYRSTILSFILLIIITFHETVLHVPYM